MGQTTYRLVQDFSHQQYVKQQIQVDGIWLSTNAEAVTSNSKQGLLDRKDLTKQVATLPPPKTNMAKEHPPFEDAFPIEHRDFPMLCWFSGV